MKVRDTMWVWGHPANSLKGAFGIKQDSFVTPAEGMKWLGARNIWYVPMGHPVDKEQCCVQAADAAQIGWSIEKAAKNPAAIEETIRLAKQFPQITRGIFDDFFNEENVENNNLLYTPQLLADMREQLHRAGLEMWQVLYTKQFYRQDMGPFIDMFDGVSMWFWDENDVKAFEQRYARFIELTPGKRRMIGCYLYDFGGEKPADPELVCRQLDRCLDLLRQKQIDGVILHTNAVCGMGHPAPEAARQWLTQHGDEIV